MSSITVLPGAESWSASGGTNGVLVLHGFTGCPQSMRPLAEACAAAGFSVELPRLPGHGTTIADMLPTSWTDWSRAAAAAYDDLAARCARVVVCGLSMGATLTAWLATQRPDVAGIVVINGAFGPIDEAVRGAIVAARDSGLDRIPGPGGDIAEPGREELAYGEAPVAGLLSLLDAADALQESLARIAIPALVITSRQDHVVPPSASEHFVAAVGGPVEHVWLERSYHVATLDFDAHEIEERTVAFARRVTA
ncbi:MAG TPA: alpha/beta fold hydrolase [Acidimicrobiia bacterium]